MPIGPVLRLTLVSMTLGFALSCSCGGPPAGDDPFDAGGDGGTDNPLDAGRDADGDGGFDAGPAVTWYRDVLPVAQVRCMGCHVEGGIGTFSMEDAETARSLALTMASAVASGRMPPWSPSLDCHDLQDERIITADEVALFGAWADDDAPLGDPADAPPPLVEPPGLDAPDVELTVPAYRPDFSEQPDDYRCLVVDPQLAQNEHVVALEFAPDRGEMVHHIIVYRADRDAAVARDAEDEGPGWTCFGGADVGQSGGVIDTLGAWAPGVKVVEYPAGTGIPLNTNHVVVLQIHYNGDNIWQPEAPLDETGLKLRYAAGTVASATLLPAPLDTFEIPPGATGHTATATVPIPIPGGRPIYGLMPHMHNLGTSIKVTSSAAGCLVDVPAWDFSWQQAYFFKDGPVNLPFGSSLTMTCTWDNPTADTVTWGEGTDDEMCLVYIYTVL